MSDTSPVRVTVEGPVGRLTLNRPEKRNALALETFAAYAAALDELDRDPAVRVIVVDAAGEGFCAGIDLGALDELLADTGADGRERMRRELRVLQDNLGAAERTRKPVIAAIQGLCIGAGLDLASACDIRLASANALFSIRETKVAIVADVGTLQRLPDIIGHGWFRELALTGRNFTAEEALQMGFVTRVCADHEALLAAARAVAEEIAANSPLAVQGVKDVILHTRDHGVRAGLEYVAQKNAVLLYCDDLREALQAFQERRPPRFRGR